VTEISADLAATTCRCCRANLGLDADTNENRRLEALFVLAITLGLRPGELRKLAWDHVDLDNAVIHVWRSASRTGDVKTRSPNARSSSPSAPSPRSSSTGSARPPNGWPQVPYGRITT
jgi:integrase